MYWSLSATFSLILLLLLLHAITIVLSFVLDLVPFLQDTYLPHSPYFRYGGGSGHLDSWSVVTGSFVLHSQTDSWSR